MESCQGRIPCFIQQLPPTQEEITRPLYEGSGFGRSLYNKKREVSLRQNYSDGILLLPQTEKMVYLFPPSQTKYLSPLYQWSSIVKEWEINSAVNPVQPDPSHLPLYSQSEYITVGVQKGNGLYIPFGWWYFVEQDDDTMEQIKWNHFLSLPFKCLRLGYDVLQHK